jgi:hypothetical protein
MRDAVEITEEPKPERTFALHTFPLRSELDKWSCD